MEVEPNVFSCLWCASTFPRRYLVGRKPHYCSATCRQRAYEERRRGARYAGKPASTFLTRLDRRPPPPAAHESGRNHGTRHALRPAGLPDRWRRRPTLCGTWASPVRPRFDVANRNDRHICEVCHWLAGLFPPPRRVDPVIDVAALTQLIRRLPPSAENHELFAYCGLQSEAPLDRRPPTGPGCTP
jgi:hypothetical protein